MCYYLEGYLNRFITMAGLISVVLVYIDYLEEFLLILTMY